jgi:Mycobacterial 4 TMS phage holin, superfamily IV
MIRFLVSVLVTVIASAIGLIVADLVLDDFSLQFDGFLIALGIFAVSMMLFHPFLQKMALKNVRALSGGTALVATLLSLIVADVVSDGLSITGGATWLLAALIVWVASLIAVLIVPLLLVKAGIQSARDNRN